MNAPERHRSYQLDEGQARMTYEPDQRVASAGTCVWFIPVASRGRVASMASEAVSRRWRLAPPYALAANRRALSSHRVDGVRLDAVVTQ